MRKNRLLTATALSLTLSVFSLSGPAMAATTISTATTAPVVTAVAGDLTVTSAGSITLTSGTAITVDSDNDVTLNGKIDMLKSAAGSTGVLISGGRTSDLTVAANITVTDDYTATDSKNTDGVIDGPFADTATRYGIRSTGATPFVGNVDIKSTSTIVVEGSNAYGIRFENNVQGNFTMDGAIGNITTPLEGDNNVGVSLENGVTGTTYLSGAVVARGTNTSAVKLAGEFDGTVIIDGTYSTTGYATVTSVSDVLLEKIIITPEDMGQSGVTVDISGNVDKGILVGAALIGTVDTNTDPNIDSNPDEDGNGILDVNQTTASIINYGSAPALRIASATQDLTVGGLVYNSSAVTPPTVNYGLAIRGNVTGTGIYSGINATAVQLGGLGHKVVLANGIHVKGTVLGQAVGGIATGLKVASGTTTPLLDVDGLIRANGSSTRNPTTTGTTTTYGPSIAGSSIAIDILTGADLPVINVNSGGAIAAQSVGSSNTTVAVRDTSNTLKTLTNEGIISATVALATYEEASSVLTRPIAVDTRSNTVGLSLTQTDVAPGDTEADRAIAAPYIVGDILLGSGNDSISSSGGSIFASVDMGAGANSFSLSNGAVYVGKMTGVGTTALNVSNGTLSLSSGSQVNTTTVDIGASGTLGLTIDTDNPNVPVLAGTGAVTFADGAKLRLTLSKLFTNASTFNIITGSSISLGNVASSLDGNVPFIYTADLKTRNANTALDVDLRLKTQAEGGFSGNQYAALVPVLTAAAGKTLDTQAFMSQFTQDGFNRVYNQYLPDHSGENIIGLSLGSTSLNRSLGALSLIPTDGTGQYWLQEYGYQTERDYGETMGFESTGFSFAGGREQAIYGNQTIGMYLSYTAATPTDTFAISAEEMVNSDATIGGYWRIRSGAFKGWAHAGVGFASFESLRQNASLAYTSQADWSGFSYSGGVGASVDYRRGGFSMTPTLLASYYALSEEEHTETGGGSSFDLTVAERDSHLLSSTAMVNFSYGRFFLKPELWVGYKQNISAEIADTVANFANGTPFTLTGGSVEGGGPVAGFRLSADNQWSYFGIEGDYESLEQYTNYSISLRTRFQF